jgi:hypothetical protein
MNNVIQMPVVQTASIASGAMLVDVSIRVWEGRKTDKGASAEVTSRKNAKRGTARVSKDLLSECEELLAIKKHAAYIRASVHYPNTLPWSDSGLRLLVTGRYAAYRRAMSAAVAEFEKLVQEFLDVYEWEIAKAASSLGDLFNRSEYPTVDALATKFSVAVGYMPVPEVGDWRVDIGREGVNQLRDQYGSYYQQQLQNAMTDVWTRASKALERMSERLDFAEDGTKKIFRDSLVDNVLEVVDLMATCNLTKDASMIAIEQRLRRALTGIDAEGLRKDANLRVRTKAEVDAAIAALPGLGI